MQTKTTGAAVSAVDCTGMDNFAKLQQLYKLMYMYMCYMYIVYLDFGNFFQGNSHSFLFSPQSVPCIHIQVQWVHIYM